jgi:hypothetical protein
MGLCPIPHQRTFCKRFFGISKNLKRGFYGALPHTPLKELFEKSSLRILKNFGKILKYVLKVLEGRWVFLLGALPHTPLKELFEKSSLRILKNFGKILKYVLKVLGRCGTLLSRRVPHRSPRSLTSLSSRRR